MVEGIVQPAYRIEELRSLAVSEDPNRHDRATGGAHLLWNGHPLRDRQRFFSDVILAKRRRSRPQRSRRPARRRCGAKKRRPGLRRTVRGDTVRPSFSRSSAAIRSSPSVGTHNREQRPPLHRSERMTSINGAQKRNDAESSNSVSDLDRAVGGDSRMETVRRRSWN
jgi:hypothetical protein